MDFKNKIKTTGNRSSYAGNWLSTPLVDFHFHLCAFFPYCLYSWCPLLARSAVLPPFPSPKLTSSIKTRKSRPSLRKCYQNHKNTEQTKLTCRDEWVGGLIKPLLIQLLIVASHCLALIHVPLKSVDSLTSVGDESGPLSLCFGLDWPQ